MADNIGATTIILYFPHRGRVYFRHATKNDAPNDSFEVGEAKMLKKFSHDHGIHFLDTSSQLIGYVETIPQKSSNIYKLPYLSYDAHMSPVGHQIVAELVASELEILEPRSTKGFD